jgi:hypothetical protein
VGSDFHAHARLRRDNASTALRRAAARHDEPERRDDDGPHHPPPEARLARAGTPVLNVTYARLEFGSAGANRARYCTSPTIQ